MINSTALIKISISLAAIVALILALAFLARKLGLGSTQNTHHLRVLHRLRLGPRMQLMIIENNNKQLLIGVTPHHITLLDSPSHSPNSGSLSFHEVLTHCQDKHPPTFNHDDSAPPSQPNIKKGISIFFLFGLFSALLGALVFFSPSLHAQTLPLPAIASSINEQGEQVWSLSIETLVLLTLITFIPAALIMMTGFTRIIIVLGLLRNAMGTGAAPPNSILIGIALFLTFFAMAPVFDDIYEHAYLPLSHNELNLQQALERGAEPLKEFMLHQTREHDLIFYADLAHAGPFEGPEQGPLRILVPAFITSELKTAFQIGFTIFIPFLIIDLLVASVLMSLGMMMVPPVTISLPFKLMLFVLADGWHLLLGSLARSFYF